MLVQTCMSRPSQSVLHVALALPRPPGDRLPSPESLESLFTKLHKLCWSWARDALDRRHHVATRAAELHQPVGATGGSPKPSQIAVPNPSALGSMLLMRLWCRITPSCPKDRPKANICKDCRIITNIILLYRLYIFIGMGFKKLN